MTSRGSAAARVRPVASPHSSVGPRRHGGGRPRRAWRRRRRPKSTAMLVTTGAQTLAVAVRRARRAQHDRLALHSGSMISSAKRDLPAPASPMIDTTPLWPLRSELHGGLQERSLVLVRPTNALVAPHRSHARLIGAGDQPRLLVPARGPRMRVMPNGSRWIDGGHRAMRRRTDQHPPGGASAAAAGGVDDVAHRGVVGPGERADQHLAGVDADAHPHRTACRLRDVSGRASPASAAPARTARSASSSWATGAPNRATIASPSILSTRPPKALDVGDEALEAGSTRRLTCSGSRCSANVVKPTRSANSTRGDAPLLERDGVLKNHGAARRAEASPRWHRMAARSHTQPSPFQTIYGWGVASSRLGGWSINRRVDDHHPGGGRHP